MNNVKLTVFIVNFNTRELLGKCIGSIYRNSVKFKIEIIVIDRFSEDGSKEMIEDNFPEVAVFSLDNKKHYPEALNKYMQKGKGEYFLVSHPDILFIKNSLEEMVSFLDNHQEVGIIGANQIYPDNTFVPSSIKNPTIGTALKKSVLGFLKYFLKSVESKSGMLDRWDHTQNSCTETVWACYAIRKKVLAKTGLFDENFVYAYSNNDICYRARLAGWDIVYLSSARIIHYEIQTPENIYSKKGLEYKRFGSAMAETVEKDFFYFISKYYSKRDFEIFRIIKVFDYAVRTTVFWLLRILSGSDDNRFTIRIKRNLSTMKSIIRTRYSS